MRPQGAPLFPPGAGVVDDLKARHVEQAVPPTHHDQGEAAAAGVCNPVGTNKVGICFRSSERISKIKI